jgi:hypothetical protein
MALAMLGAGLGATPASALNHDTYNILKNVDQHHYCLDIDTNYLAPAGAPAHLWTCSRPVVPEQQFLLVADIYGHDHIKVQRSGYCLEAPAAPIDGTVVQEPCDPNQINQSWVLTPSGSIVMTGAGRCLDVFQADTKGTAVEALPCNGNISQHWFF